MATRSCIAKHEADGTVRGIYCHFDGYPAGVGVTLQTHYIAESQVDALLKLGDLSILGDEIGEAHPFDQTLKPDGTHLTTAYHRDRGEEYRTPSVWPSAGALLTTGRGFGGVDYIYIWIKGDWYIARAGEYGMYTVDLAVEKGI